MSKTTEVARTLEERVNRTLDKIINRLQKDKQLITENYTDESRQKAERWIADKIKQFVTVINKVIRNSPEYNSWDKEKQREFIHHVANRYKEIRQKVHEIKRLRVINVDLNMSELIKGDKIKAIDALYSYDRGKLNEMDKREYLKQLHQADVFLIPSQVDKIIQKDNDVLYIEALNFLNLFKERIGMWESILRFGDKKYSDLPYPLALKEFAAQDPDLTMSELGQAYRRLSESQRLALVETVKYEIGKLERAIRHEKETAPITQEAPKSKQNPVATFFKRLWSSIIIAFVWLWSKMPWNRVTVGSVQQQQVATAADQESTKTAAPSEQSTSQSKQTAEPDEPKLKQAIEEQIEKTPKASEPEQTVEEFINHYLSAPKSFDTIQMAQKLHDLVVARVEQENHGEFESRAKRFLEVQQDKMRLGDPSKLKDDTLKQYHQYENDLAQIGKQLASQIGLHVKKKQRGPDFLYLITETSVIREMFADGKEIMFNQDLVKCLLEHERMLSKRSEVQKKPDKAVSEQIRKRNDRKSKKKSKAIENESNKKPHSEPSIK